MYCGAGRSTGLRGRLGGCKKYGGRDSTDLVLFAWKFMSKEAIGPHVNVDWQAVEFEMREIVR